MKVFIANVGNRDIALNISDSDIPLYYPFAKEGGGGEEVRKYLGCEEGTRAIACYIKDNIKIYRDRLKFPIIIPSLQLALREGNSFELVLLLATDQSDEKHRIWDTIESGKVLQMCLPSIFQNKIDKDSVKIAEVEINPSLHEAAYSFVGNILSKYLPLNQPHQVFAAIKGGTPAMNAALREQVVDRYGSQAVLIETDEPSKTDRVLEGIEGNARVVNNWPFRKNALLRIIRTLLERYDYRGVQELLEAEGVKHVDVERFLQHAQYRLNLNFEEAAEILNIYNQRDSAPYNWSKLVKMRDGQRLVELILMAQIMLKRKDYISFVTRIASFCETCYRYVIQLSLKLIIDGNLLTNGAAFSYSQVLFDFLENSTLIKIRNEGWKTDRRLLNNLIDWGTKQNWANREIFNLVNNIRADIKKFAGLEDLRNETLHMVKGISAKDINEAFANCENKFLPFAQRIIDKVKQLEQGTGNQATYRFMDIYQNINENIILKFQEISE